MKFRNGTYPNGDVWVSRGAIDPDQLPDGNLNFNSYFVVNNYGTNQAFSKLSNMKFTGNSAYVSTSASAYKLYKRVSNSFGATWGGTLDNGDSVSGLGVSTIVKFSKNLNVTTFSQFVLSNTSGTASKEALKNEGKDEGIQKEFEKPIIYPNPIKVNFPLIIDLPEEWINSTMVVYDLLGNKVTETSLKKGSNRILLNVSSGIYSVLIFNQKGNYRKKIIIE
jgi:hypothetical protein